MTAIKFISAFLLPPLNLLTLAVIGTLLAGFRRRIGFVLTTVSVAGLTALSMPVIANTLLAWIEIRELPDRARLLQSQAIVILGGGTYPNAPEYGGDTAGSATLERLRYGARLQRQSDLPILVSGGNPLGYSTTEAQQMRIALAEDFKIDVRWMEPDSRNTRESALRTRQLLSTEKIDRITLVTHASHMRRATLVFERAGFSVTKAPTGFSPVNKPRNLGDFLPSAEGLGQSRIFFYELFGLGWYHLRLAGLRD